MKKFFKKYIPRGKSLEYALIAGLEYNTLLAWQKGIRQPTAMHLIYLCRALANENKSLDYDKIVQDAFEGAYNAKYDK